MAEAAARHLVRAEAQGLPTHGMSRVRGRIMMAVRRGKRIPEGWALDRDGRPTTDAVRLSGTRWFAGEAASAAGIEVPDELLAQVEKLCST